MAAAAGEGYAATTWADENRALFRALRLEKLVTALFIGLITFVAGLNILVVLAMTVTRPREGHRGADGHGRTAGTDSRRVLGAGFGGRRNWHSWRDWWQGMGLPGRPARIN